MLPKYPAENIVWRGNFPPQVEQKITYARAQLIEAAPISPIRLFFRLNTTNVLFWLQIVQKTRRYRPDIPKLIKFGGGAANEGTFDHRDEMRRTQDQHRRPRLQYHQCGSGRDPTVSTTCFGCHTHTTKKKRRP